MRILILTIWTVLISINHHGYSQSNTERCLDALDSLYEFASEEQAWSEQLESLSESYPNCDLIDLEIAIAAYDDLDTTTALAAIDRYVGANPSDPERLLQRASMLIDYEREEAARRDLEKLVDLTASDTAYRIELVRFERDLGNHELALELLTPLSNDSSWIAWYLVEKARVLSAMEEYKEAYQVTTEVTEYYPEFCDGWYLRAKLMYEVWGLDTKPVEYLFRALDICDDYMAVKCLSLLARLFEEFEDYDKALGAHDQILDLVPYDPEALYNSAVFKSSIGLYEECVIELENYLDIVGEDPAGRFELAYCMAGAELLPEAIEEFTEVLKMDSTDIEVWFNRAASYTKLGEFNPAIADYTMVLELDPTDTDALFNRGLVYHQKGEFQKAVDDFTAYLMEHPNDPNALLNRGYAKYYGDDEAGACADWDRMKKIEPDLYKDVKVFCKD